jgi:hypothetical protein
LFGDDAEGRAIATKIKAYDGLRESLVPGDFIEINPTERKIVTPLATITTGGAAYMGDSTTPGDYTVFSVKILRRVSKKGNPYTVAEVATDKGTYIAPLSLTKSLVPHCDGTVIRVVEGEDKKVPNPEYASALEAGGTRVYDHEPWSSQGVLTADGSYIPRFLKTNRFSVVNKKVGALLGI